MPKINNSFLIFTDVKIKDTKIEASCLQVNGFELSAQTDSKLGISFANF